MIRIYLDWNVVSNLKKPAYSELLEFITENKNCFQFIYTPAHFHDLMKSYSLDNQYFEEDLKTLEFLAERHFMMWHYKKGLRILLGTPSEYFKDDANQMPNRVIDGLEDLDQIYDELDEHSKELGLGKIGSIAKKMFKLMPSGVEINDQNRDQLKKLFPDLKENSSFWDLMKTSLPATKKLLLNKDQYKELRSDGFKAGLKLPAEAGNWKHDEVIKNINQHLKNFEGIEMTFFEQVEKSFEHRKDGNNINSFYQTAYLMLDTYGYKTDKLKKPTDNLLNSTNDAEHSFYGLYCDYFVAEDKNLVARSKVLYHSFKVDTKVLKPKELVSELKEVIHDLKNDTNVFKTAIDLMNAGTLVETVAASKEMQTDFFVYKLPRYFFNFFNHCIYARPQDSDQIIISYTLHFDNLSDFIYFTESERLFDDLINVFGFDRPDKLEALKKDFVYGDFNNPIVWNLGVGFVSLEKLQDTRRPILKFNINRE